MRSSPDSQWYTQHGRIFLHVTLCILVKTLQTAVTIQIVHIWIYCLLMLNLLSSITWILLQSAFCRALTLQRFSWMEIQSNSPSERVKFTLIYFEETIPIVFSDTFTPVISSLKVRVTPQLTTLWWWRRLRTVMIPGAVLSGSICNCNCILDLTAVESKCFSVFIPSCGSTLQEHGVEWVRSPSLWREVEKLQLDIAGLSI